MRAPNLTPEQVRAAFPEITTVGAPFPPSGQKQVFPCADRNGRFVLKFMAPDLPDEEQSDSIEESTVYRRAKREFDIMVRLNSEHIPAPGPIGLDIATISGQRMIMFSEELIEGNNLHEIIAASGALPQSDVVRLGLHINTAINLLWAENVIHRDIKPGNIMRRNQSGAFVLLDAGLAFDLTDDSLTETGFVPHTPGYIAPEQLDPQEKRQNDCRADMFLLGIVLYEAATGLHPFKTRPNIRRGELITNIRELEPPAPHTVRLGLSPELGALVMRLLQKQRHLRFRNCEQLDTALRAF